MYFCTLYVILCNCTNWIISVYFTLIYCTIFNVLCNLSVIT